MLRIILNFKKNNLIILFKFFYKKYDENFKFFNKNIICNFEKLKK